MSLALAHVVNGVCLCGCVLSFVASDTLKQPSSFQSSSHSSSLLPLPHLPPYKHSNLAPQLLVLALFKSLLLLHTDTTATFTSASSFQQLRLGENDPVVHEGHSEPDDQEVQRGSSVVFVEEVLKTTWVGL